MTNVIDVFTGRNNALSREDQLALKKIIDLDSEFAFYSHVAFDIFRDSWIHHKVTFAQLAISVAPPDENVNDLWDTVIESNIALGQYDDAYAAIIAAPPEPVYVSFLLDCRLTLTVSTEKGTESLA